MKRVMKQLCKILSVFLAVLLVFEIIPMQVVAESADAVKSVAQSKEENEPEDTQSAEDKVLDENGNVKILCEDETKREEYVKHFRMSDGTYQAVVYEMPVHIEKDGEWVDYDNSLSKVPSDEARFARGILNKDLVNTFGDYTVRFSEKSNMSKLVRLTKDVYDLSWNFSGSNKKSAQTVDCEDDGDETTLENLTSQVIYEDLFDGADLQYIVMPEQLKENIILKDSSAPRAFSVEYSAENLAPVSVDEKTVILQNENGEAVFTLSAPVMYDAAGEASDGITLALSDITESGFTVTMSLDEQWLGSADRQFPVTVDPAIKTEQDRNEMTSTFVASGYPNKAFGSTADDAGSMYVGDGIANYGKTKAYIKINNLPSIGGKNSKVIGAQLAVFKRNVYSTTNDVVIYAHQVTSAWSKSSLTYNSQPSCDGNVADYTVLTADNKTQSDYHDNYIYPEFKSFDITKLVYAWYEGTAANYGIVLETQQTNTHKVWFHSIEYTTYPTTRPVLSVSYRNMSGVESYWSYTSLPAGRNGTASVNNYNGNFVFTQPLTQDLGGNLMPVAISLVYNSNRDSENVADLGGGMQTNYNITLHEESGKLAQEGYKYYLSDADGTKHWFYFENGASSGKDEDGLGYTLNAIEANTDPDFTVKGFKITDKDKNRMYFDEVGRIIKFINANGVWSKVEYAVHAGQTLLARVIDGAGRVYSFYYDYINGSSTYYLVAIEDPANRFTKFGYDPNNRITSIIFPDGESIPLRQSYGNYLILNRIGSIDGNRVNIEYDAGANFRVRSFSWGSDSEGLPSRYQFAYYPNETTVQSQHMPKNSGIITDNTYTYQFNNYGQNTGIVSHDDGEAQYFDYQNSKGTNSKSSQTNNKLISQSKVIKSVTNLLCNQGFRDGFLYYTPVVGGNSSVSINSSRGYLDGNAVEFSRPYGGSGDCLLIRDFTLPTGNYTLSGYVTTDNSELSGAGTYIGVKKQTSENNSVYIYAENVKKTDGWQRFSVSFSVNSGDSVRLFCGLDATATGKVLLDNLQLETGMGASSYNLLQNSDAGSSTYGWTSTGSLSVTSGMTDSSKSFSVGGSVNDKYRGIQQNITVAGEKGDVYSIGAWVSARSVPTTSGLKPNDPKFGIALHFYNSAGQKVGVKEIDANPEVSSWQFVSGKAIAPDNYSYVCFETYYYNNANRVYTTGAFCYKEEFGQTYTYDNNGNVVSSEDLSKSNSSFGYQGNNLSGMLNPSGSSYLYTYDNANNIRTAFSTDGLKYYLEYDGKGNVKNTVTKGVKVARDVIDTDKTYSIVNQLTSYALDMNNDHELINLSYQNSAAHQWKFEFVRNGVYKIRTLDGHYIKVEDNAYGSKLKMTESGDSSKCNLTVQPTGDGAFVISTASAGDCNYYLDSTDGSSFTADNYSAVTQRVLRTPKNTSQKWYLIEDYTTDGSNAKRMYSSAEYTTDNNYLEAQNDQAGNTTVYKYNSKTGQMDSVSSGMEKIGEHSYISKIENSKYAFDENGLTVSQTKGKETKYQYNEQNNILTSVSAGGITNTYSYSAERLKGINVNNSTHYSFSYDQFGRTVSTKVGNGTDYEPLSTLTYDQKGLMTRQTYGNDDYISFAYDSLDRLSEKSYNDRKGNPVAKKQYLYGNDGNISLTVDYATNSYTRYNYDLSGRTASVREYSGTDISSNTPISYTEYRYADKTNYLTNVKFYSMLGTQNIAYKYGNINNGEMPDQVYSVSWNGVEKVKNEYDYLSRLSTRKVNGLATNYTYKDISENQTTTLVESINTDGITYSYDYDEVNNIKSVTVGNKKTTYEYDELNQLTRVNDPFENVTHVYTYKNGNIVYDLVYEYSVGALPSYPQSTTQYLYENDTWSDVLTGVKKSHYEGSTEVVDEQYSVSSDKIGNTIGYKGSTYTWVGRQLRSITNSDNSSTTYSYNSDGQRISKIVNTADGKMYNYRYYYNGDILAGFILYATESGSMTYVGQIRFMYDESGEAFGIEIGGKEYFYVKNAQNDVVRIVDSANETVVSYQYDSWGKLLSCEDTSENDIVSFINPYTYRGYYYDSDTEMYFLKSRYYNPELHRFINADGYVQTGQGVLSLNTFAYCVNNPIIFADETGQFIGAIVGGIIGAISGGISAKSSGRTVLSGVIGGFVGGFVCGLIADAGAALSCVTGGLALAVIGGALAGAAGNYLTQLINAGQKTKAKYKNSKVPVSKETKKQEIKSQINKKEIVHAATVGAVSNLIGFGAGKLASAAASNLPASATFLEKFFEPAHNAGLAITSAFTGAQACSLGICFDMSLQVVEEAMA